MPRLESLTSWITGAGSGIGRSIALAFAAEGSRVFATDLSLSAAIETQEIWNKSNPVGAGSISPAELDVTNLQAIDTIATGAECDVLVNCAGIGAVGTIIQSSLADLDRLYRVNVGGVFAMTRPFLPAMLSRGLGSIINIASIGGIVGIPDRVAYCTSKFAVVGMTRCIALDHAKSGVRVNCICPARVETPFVQQRIREYPDPKAAYEAMSQSQPIGRMARPEEIAAAAVYLASSESAFVTGSALIIDGGYSAGH